MEKNAVVLADGTDADVIGIAEDSLEAAVQLFHVRGGRVRGQRGWVVDKVEDVSTSDLVEHFLVQMYGETGADADPGPQRPQRRKGSGPGWPSGPRSRSRARCSCRRCPTTPRP